VTPRWAQWVPWVLLGGFSALWLARWVSFPLFIDPYYHLMVAQQVADAGGPIAYEWWEAAPEGRPHLYPPAIHLVIAGLLALGFSPLTAIRLVSAVLPALTLLTIYLAARRLFNPAVALAALLMAFVPFSWMLQTAHGMASAVAGIELLWLLVSVCERRWIAAASWVGLLFYTHLGLPWIGLAAIGVGLLVNAFAPHPKLLASLGAGILLGAPWLWHLAAHRGLLQITARQENRSLEIAVPLYLLACFGVWRAWRQRGRPRVLIALWVACALMAPAFTARWLSGEGLLPAILLAGYGLERASGLLQKVPGTFPRTKSTWYFLNIVAGGALVMACPSLRVGRDGPRLLWPESVPFHLLYWKGVERKPLDAQLYASQTRQLADSAAQLTQPGEILWANANYAGGIVAVLAHRATSSAMFYEALPGRERDPIASAHLILWFKVDPIPGVPPLEVLIDRYRLQAVAETPVARIYRNPAAPRRSHAPVAVIPWWMAFVLSCGLIGGTQWEKLRRFSSAATRRKRGSR